MAPIILSHIQYPRVYMLDILLNVGTANIVVFADQQLWLAMAQ